MRTIDPPLPIASTGVSEVAPGAEPPMGSRLNLARPWKFPAAHADSIQRRRHPRTRVRVPIEFSLYRADGSFYDEGAGVIRDLSYSGASLDDVFLLQGALLALRFGVEQRIALESSGGVTIAGRILRVSPDGFGIEFLLPGSGERLLKLE